ncbi:MAG: hypothetical protein WBO92_02980 [Candidatus Moraniibacteriota bacterium]
MQQLGQIGENAGHLLTRGVRSTLIIVLLLALPVITHAATWYLNENESGTVGSSLGAGNTSAGPYFFEYWCPGPVTCGGETATYQSAGGRPSGGKFVQFHNYNLQHDYNYQAYNGSALYGSSTFSAGSPASLANGSTVYWGAFIRYRRVGSIDVFHDTGEPDSYSKMLEIDGDNLRHMILSGYANSPGNGQNHKFTYQNYVSPTYCPSCGPSPGVFWPAEMRQNVAPYTYPNLYMVDYDKWYAVVARVTLDNGYNGRLQLWINGTLVSDYTGRTLENAGGATLSRINGNGTVAQPAYDAPEHYYDIDGIFATDSLTFLQNNGYFADPEGSADTTPPAAPASLAVE